jgi:hypothetical protein
MWPADLPLSLPEINNNLSSLNRPASADLNGLNLPLMNPDDYLAASPAFNHQPTSQPDAILTPPPTDLNSFPASGPGTPSGDSKYSKPVTVTIALQNPDSQTMQSLIKFAMENEAKFCIERE